MSKSYQECASSSSCRIYVADLAAYNASILRGVWIDANQDAEDILEEIEQMLAASPEPIAEEFAIHDYEGFGGVTVGEYDSIEDVAALAQMIEQHGPAWAVFADLVGIDYATEEGFENSYCGEWDDEEDFTQNTIDEGLWGEIPDHLVYYIDTEKMARDLFINDYYGERDADGQFHVFRRT